MNVSTISVYDNVSYDEDKYSKPCFYDAINDLLSINDEVEVTLFCPLCVKAFRYKFSLFEHLKTFHQNMLSNASNLSFRFNECPFCNAKFYGERLVAKHCLVYHPKVIKELFVDGDSKCLFCDEKQNKKEIEAIMRHLEDFHFIDFEEELKRKFLSTVTEMSFSEYNNLTNTNFNVSSSLNFIDASSSNSDTGGQEFFASALQNYEKASIVNCFDFTDLKEQLQSIKNYPSNSKASNRLKKRKSILKNITSNSPNTAVRRVLRFDLPSYSYENKENSVLRQNLTAFKQVSIEEHRLLCNDNKLNLLNLLTNTSDDWCGIPICSSTPKSRLINSEMKISEKNYSKQIEKNINLKSFNDLTSDFEFKCGKCMKLFKDNLELVYHVKTHHKKFGLRVFKPSYRCAICNATFYKNNYLKKHHRLHKPY